MMNSLTKARFRSYSRMLTAHAHSLAHSLTHITTATLNLENSIHLAFTPCFGTLPLTL